MIGSRSSRRSVAATSFSKDVLCVVVMRGVGVVLQVCLARTHCMRDNTGIAFRSYPKACLVH